MHVSVVIGRSADDVYAYVADLDHLPAWAAGLAAGIERTADPRVVVTDSPMGQVSVRFAAPNEFGVVDHDVTLPDGEVVSNPMRVLPHPEGSEVVFTVRQRGMSDHDFARDCTAVQADLDTLRTLLEE